MNKTSVVNIRLDKYDVYCGRGSIFGNPYEIGRDGPRDVVIARYKVWFEFLLEDPIFRQEVEKLRGKKLGCFCKQKVKQVPCHVDVIADYLNKA